MKKIEEKKETTTQPSFRSVKAVLKYARIGPRKVRIVIDAIRRRPPHQAFGILMTFKKKGARLAEKVLKTAVANAKVMGLDQSRLYISDIRADGGPVMKRFMERSMGRGNRILKRTTHLSLILSEGERTWKDAVSLETKEEQKETPKAGKAEKKPTGRKKASAKA